MKHIIIDTNALMAIAELKIDVFSEIERIADFKYELWVLEGSIAELETIKTTQRGKYKLAAKLVLDIVKKKKVKIMNSSENVDDDLVELSQKGYLILTQDRELKQRLKKPYLTIRQGKTVAMVK